MQKIRPLRLRLVLPLPELHWINRFALKCFQFLIDSSLWIAAALASLVFYVQHTLNLPPDFRPIALIFCAALTFYNLDRVADARLTDALENQRLAFFRSPGILLLMLGSGIATVVLLVQAPIAVQRVSIVGLFSLIYGIPLFPGQQNGQTHWYRIKDIPGAKAWIVCGTIAFALTAVPLAYADQPFSIATVLTTIFLLVITGSNSHVFDIRDLEDDRAQGVPTLPVLLGVLPTRILLTGMNAIGLIALLSGWINGWNVPSGAVVLPMTLLTLIYIWTVTPETGRSIYNICIDGLLFLPALGVWL